MGQPKGCIPWNKEKPWTEETLKKMRKPKSEEAKQNMRGARPNVMGEKNPHWGKPAWNRGIKYKNANVAGEKNGMWRKPPTTKGKTYEENFGPEKAKELKENRSLTSKNNWENKDCAKKMRASMRPSGPELYLDFLLQNHFPDEWWFVGDGEIVISGLCPDFINCNGKKLIIEVFGDYWHNRKNMKHHQTEEGRKEVFSKPGYSTLVIWEHELVDEQKLIEKIRCFNESTN